MENALIQDNVMSLQDFDPTPRASNFPKIEMPIQPFSDELLSPYPSDILGSPFSSPSPLTESSNTSVSVSPLSIRSSLPPEDYASHNFVPLDLPKPSRRRSNHNPRKGDPSYIPRPENAFILFRKDVVMKMRAIESQDSTNDKSDKSTPAAAGKRRRQADMSKSISGLWRDLNPQERAHWEQMAAIAKQEHEVMYPGYRYRPTREVKPKSIEVGRKGAAATGRSRNLRSKTSSVVTEKVEDVGGLSKDLAVVVRPTRGPRRSSSLSAAKQTATSPFSIPVIESVSRPGSPYPSIAYSRTRRDAKQWVSPPIEDPSPPPSELFFPRAKPECGLEAYFGGYLNLNSPSPAPLEDSNTPAFDIQAAGADAIMREPAINFDDRNYVFVPPITSERYETPNFNLPYTPRRPSSRLARSISMPSSHPLQLTQSSPLTFDESTLGLGLSFGPRSSDVEMSPDPVPALELPQATLSGNESTGLSSFSSPESDVLSDFSAYNADEEEWMSKLGPFSSELGDLVGGEDFGLFNYMDFGFEDAEKEKEKDCAHQ